MLAKLSSSQFHKQVAAALEKPAAQLTLADRAATQLHCLISEIAQRALHCGTCLLFPNCSGNDTSRPPLSIRGPCDLCRGTMHFLSTITRLALSYVDAPPDRDSVDAHHAELPDRHHSRDSDQEPWLYPDATPPGQLVAVALHDETTGAMCIASCRRASVLGADTVDVEYSQPGGDAVVVKDVCGRHEDGVSHAMVLSGAGSVPSQAQLCHWSIRWTGWHGRHAQKLRSLARTDQLSQLTGPPADRLADVSHVHLRACTEAKDKFHEEVVRSAAYVLSFKRAPRV